MSQQFIIYGAGQYGKLFDQALREDGNSVVFFIDKYTQKTQLNNLPIYSPTQVPDKLICVLISVPKYEDEIENELQTLGFTNIKKFSEAMLLMPKLFFLFAKENNLWLSDSISKRVDEKQLLRLETLLDDDKSKNILKNLISFRKSLSVEQYVSPDLKIEYFTDDFNICSLIKEPIRFIDAGAYTGDTLLSLFNHTNNVEFIGSFEPDHQNFTQLQNTISTLAASYTNVQFITFPLGLWRESSILKFSISGTSGSGIAKKESLENVSIPVCSIDETLFFIKPNFIKMDIEGAELEALKGAQKTIQTYKPVLAICLYHKPADLWEIPLLIHEILPNEYKMHLRVHEHVGLSTILYCIPRRCYL